MDFCMKQRIFIGSSSEGRPVCDALMAQLTGIFEVVPWHIGFPASHTTIDSLLNELATHQFGVFVMSADDSAEVRGKDVKLPRDNVIFEAGIFMGLHGLRRTFLVCPTEPSNFHFLSDLSGVTTIQFDPNAGSHAIAVAPVAEIIRQAILRANRDLAHVEIKVRKFKEPDPALTWPVKLHLSVKNPEKVPVTVQSREFRFRGARPATNDYILGGHVHNIAFRRWSKPSGKHDDQYHEVIYLRPGEEVDGWVALDKTYTFDQLLDLQNKKDIGVWIYRTTWHCESPQVEDHELVV
jgi:hypothetical protein